MPGRVVNSNILLVPISCSTYQASPDGAFADPTEFSQTSYTFVEIGNLTLTIVAMASPFSAGPGAIRLI